jgi:hypothetical protein
MCMCMHTCVHALTHTHTHTCLRFIISSYIQCGLYFVFIYLYSHKARIYIWYVFVTMCNLVPSFREMKFYGVLSRVFGKLGCATGEKRVWNTGLV